MNKLVITYYPFAYLPAPQQQSVGGIVTDEQVIHRSML